MAFNSMDLSVLAYANNFTLWHYITADETVTADEYFNKATDLLRVSDLIIVNQDTLGIPNTKFFTVTDNSRGNVKITTYG